MKQNVVQALSNREVIYEFVDTGHAIRVAAIDVETGIEVVIQAPKNSSTIEMERVAGTKLARRLGLLDSPEEKGPDDTPSGPGIKV